MDRHNRLVGAVAASTAVVFLTMGCNPSDSGGAHDSDAARAHPSSARSTPQDEEGTAAEDGSGSPDRSAATSAAPDASCAPQHLKLTLEGFKSDANLNNTAWVILKNTSGSACRTGGYVGMQLLESDGSKVPTAVRPYTQDAHAPVHKDPLTLEPDQTVWALIRWNVNHEGDAPCKPDPAKLQVTPPEASSPVESAWTYGAVCGKAAFQVTPLQNGSPYE